MMDLQTLVTKWEQQPAKWVASPQDILDLEAAAKGAKDAPTHIWADLRRVMEDHSGLDRRDIKDEIHRLQIIADLGSHPHRLHDFISAFVSSRELTYRVDGTFDPRGSSLSISSADVRNMLAAWTGDFRAFSGVAALNGAWAEWRRRTHQVALQACYERVKFDPAADGSVYDRLLGLILHPELDTAEYRIAAKAVLQNFVHRVKNSMRGQLSPRSHIMAYFKGAQGGGKSTLVDHLMAPLSEAVTTTGFDMMEDSSRMIDLTLMPIIFFDEMANASRQEMNKVKGLMTSANQQFRQLYQEAGKRNIISTFIACGNFDLDTILKDPSGNRRFLQIDVRDRFDLAAIRQLDPMDFWRSVDEGAQAPAFEEDVYSIIQAIQAGQRYQTVVERWLTSNGAIRPKSWTSCERLYRDHFDGWRAAHFPYERYDLVRFGKEMKQHVGTGTVQHRMRGGVSQYLCAAAANDDEEDGLDEVNAASRAKLIHILQRPASTAA